MWAFRLALAFLGLTIVTANNALYNLPSFSMVLKVTKSDNALIVFQDRLQDSIRAHLTNFYQGKIERPTFGRSTTVEEIALSSKLLWRELPPSESGFDKGTDPYKLGDNIRHFEVQGDYDCQLALAYNPEETGESLLSQSIMDLFLIEAFQGDNYWNLVHKFLSDEILDEITDVKITVIADGYVPNNGQDPSQFTEYSTPRDEWTSSMTVGVVFAGFFFIVLILLWVYLFCFVRGTFVWKARKSQKDGLSKAGDNTTVTGSAESCDFEVEDEEAGWMDAWANSMTSIPMRKPVKTKMRKVAQIRHPAQHHNSYLDIITESGEDDASCASESGSQRSARTLAIVPYGSTPEEQNAAAAATMQAAEAAGHQMALVPYEPPTTDMVVREGPNPQGQRKQGKKSKKSRAKFNFGKTQPQFEFATTQPQIEVTNRLC